MTTDLAAVAALRGLQHPRDGKVQLSKDGVMKSWCVSAQVNATGLLRPAGVAGTTPGEARPHGQTPAPWKKKVEACGAASKQAGEDKTSKRLGPEWISASLDGRMKVWRVGGAELLPTGP